jgi:hypothetical protein
MKHVITFIRTTVVGGVIFLIPFFIVETGVAAVENPWQAIYQKTEHGWRIAYGTGAGAALSSLKKIQTKFAKIKNQTV